MATKRKVALTSILYADSTGAKSNKRSEVSASKRIKKEDGQNGFDHSRLEEKNGIVQREFYPPEMSNERCAMYNNNEVPRPIEQLEQAIKTTAAKRAQIHPGKAVLHWFKRDLRLYDNRPLSQAAAKAKAAGISLVAMYVVSPQDYQAHFTGAARVDFDLRCLAVIKSDLDKLDVPLLVTTVEKRKEVPALILDFCKKHEINHVFCGIEYEVDELRRETKMTNLCLENGIDFTAVHDDVVVPPGKLQTGSGKQYAVYSPWFRAWVAYIHSHPEILNAAEKPGNNPPTARHQFKDVFETPIPSAPANRKLSTETMTRLERMWPAGEHEAHARLQKFLSTKSKAYKDSRNFPAQEGTAKVSIHHSAGTLAARTSIRSARDANSTTKLDGGSPGIATWISEVAWRDFYKHVLCHWPYVCMNKPFKYEYSNLEWEYDDDGYEKWCAGKTGYPIVDAAMRQMASTAYCHNRLRMIVASFLAKDLLLDWRLGERHFMLTLIDGDFASNNGGWGFSASVGVDPQPYFRIFNPLLQSEKFDPEGEFIRKWVPELKDVKGKAIHDPYGRGQGAVAKKNGYPEPMVEHKMARARALERFKRGSGRETA